MKTPMSESTTRARHLILGAVLVFCLFFISSCSVNKKVNLVGNFVHSEKRTVIELVDQEGRAWKIASVEQEKSSTYFVINSSGAVDIVAVTLSPRPGVNSTLIYVDPTEREDALAVLDKRFLSRLINSSEEYKKWLQNSSLFAHEEFQETRIIDAKRGGLGNGDIRIGSGAIVGRIAHFVCRCGELWTCTGFSTYIACFNAACDYINCSIDVLNGDNTRGCGEEESKMKTYCAIAFSEEVP